MQTTTHKYVKTHLLTHGKHDPFDSRQVAQENEKLQGITLERSCKKIIRRENFNTRRDGQNRTKKQTYQKGYRRALSSHQKRDLRRSQEKILIDVNILFSALLKDGITRKLLLQSTKQFFFPASAVSTIAKYQQYVLVKTGYSQIELKSLQTRLFANISLVPLVLIKSHWIIAEKIMEHIDFEDVTFIAAALAINAVIWSDDKHFLKQNVVSILTTKYMRLLDAP